MFAIERYDAPASLAEALALLKQFPHAVPVAGGTDVLVKLRESMEPTHLVDIAALPELQVETREADGTIRLGAGLCFSQLIRSPLVVDSLPVLAEAADSVAGPQIRNMGTLGGNICNGAVSADTVAPLLVLDAELVLAGLDGVRCVPLLGFHRGPGKVALRAGELLIEVRIAPQHVKAEPGSGIGMAWHKYAMRAAMDIATVGCAACAKVEGDSLSWLKLAFSVAAPTPVRCLTVEAAVKGISVHDLARDGTGGMARVMDVIDKTVLTDVAPRTSWRASAEFREQIIRTLAQRVSALALERAMPLAKGACHA